MYSSLNEIIDKYSKKSNTSNDTLTGLLLDITDKLVEAKEREEMWTKYRDKEKAKKAEKDYGKYGDILYDLGEDISEYCGVHIDYGTEL